jgi:O-antigen/teichoic acid export membrane protein
VIGVRWSAIARITSEVAGFASAVVLAHLIPPAEFGRVAIALILSVLATGLTNEGFGNRSFSDPRSSRLTWKVGCC